MFLKVTKKRHKGQVYKQGSIVTTVRINGKVKQKLIKNLGALRTREDEIKARDFIARVRKGKQVVILDEVNEKCFEYGVRLAVEKIWNSLDINPFLINSKIKYDISQIIYMLIAFRLHNHGSENLSEREAYRWIKEEAHHTLNIGLHHLYRSLARLLKRKEAIERYLCELLNTEKEVIFYDLTSSYVEGAYEKSDLVSFGFNRDKKKGKKQIVLGLLLADHLPLAHEVWKGKTADRSTLKEAISKLKDMGIERFIFVADRGMISEKNLEWLEQQKLEYIVATRRRKDTLVKELITKQIKEGVKKVYEKKIDKDNIRIYYLCYNEEVAKEKVKELEELKDKLRKRINAIKKPTEHKVLELVGKAKRLFKFSFGKKFRCSVNKEAFEYEKKIAGRFLLVTNNKKLGKKKILETYKELMEIEHCFRHLKHFEDMRPFFHKTDDGIRAHIFLCVLTLLVEKLISKKIPKISIREIVTELRKIKLSKTGKYLVRTDLTNIQKRILNELQIELPTKVII